MIPLVLLGLAVALPSAPADELVPLSDVTVENNTMVSLRFEGKEYVVAEGDLVLGTTTRWYIQGGQEIHWVDGDPAPAATVAGTSNPKVADIGSNADDFTFGPAGSEDGMSSIDGIDFQETLFEVPNTLFFLLERGGNDSGTWQSILPDGSLGDPVSFNAANVYGQTDTVVSGQNAFGVAFKTDAPAIGVRIAASGHDTFTISTPATIPVLAVSPLPADGAVDVSPTPTLSWNPGYFAAEHDVYFGTRFEDVNGATTADAAYVGRQASTAYAPDKLDLETTYYWRVDEVNGLPDQTVYQGQTWSFTVEPVSFAVPIGAVQATASSMSDGQDPANTVNGSGLNADGGHSNKQEHMWLGDSADAAPAIQFAFDALQKLDKMHVWNHNTQTETVLGFGVKEALIEYSVDGENWTEFGTFTLGQGNGSESYTGEAVGLDGMVARVVRLTALSNHSMLGLPQKGLGEVRFYAIPTRARLEVPASGTTDVAPLVELSWRSGREADQHQVLIGASPDTLAVVATVDEPRYTAAVDLDSTVYWQINEVNDAADPATWEGDPWSFTTTAFLTVDDMEGYQSEDGFWVWETWRDGYDDADNGALLGHDDGANMETGIVYDGRQSLPYYYGQGGAVVSEAERDIAGDWSQHGIVSFSLMFRGDPANTPGQLYIMIDDAKVATFSSANDLLLPQWQAWTFDLPASALGEVEGLVIGVEGGSGLIYIDALRVYPRPSESVTPVVPDDTELLAHYPFEGGFQDVSGNHLDGTAVGGAFIINDGERGSVVSLDGAGACVDLGMDSRFNFPGSFSLAAWVNIAEFSTDWGHNIIANRGEDGVGWQIRRHSGSSNLTFTCRGTDAPDEAPGRVDMSATFNEWAQVTAVYDLEAGVRSLYINGLLDIAVADGGAVPAAAHNIYIGARATAANDGPERFFDGLIDEVRFYNRALSQAEAMGLAERTDPVYKPF
jgi:hypothetical protein